MIISIKHDIYELRDEFSNDVRHGKLGNIKGISRFSKNYRLIPTLNSQIYIFQCKKDKNLLG